MIEVKVDTSAITAALSRLAAGSAGYPRLMRAIAGTMLSAVEDNFAAQGRPAWLGLNPKTLAGRASEKNQRGNLGAGKILQRSGALANSISPWSDGFNAQVGTNLIYAGIHQFGGKTKAHEIRPKYKKALAFGGRVVAKVNHPGSKIPARPFLQLTPSDDQAILNDTSLYLRTLF